MKWVPRGRHEEGESLYVDGRYRGGVWRIFAEYSQFYWIAYGKEDKSGWVCTLEEGKDNIVGALTLAILEAA